QLFARELFLRSFDRREIRVVQAVAAALYLLNPASITFRYVSLVATVFLSAAALFVVLMELTRLFRCLREGRPFGWWDGLILGLAIGFAAPISFPNDVRVLGIVALGLLGALGFGLFFDRKTRVQRWARRRAFITVGGGALPVAAVLTA